MCKLTIQRYTKVNIAIQRYTKYTKGGIPLKVTWFYTATFCVAESRQGFAAEVRPAEESEREKDINKRAIGRVVYSARLENEYFN